MIRIFHSTDLLLNINTNDVFVKVRILRCMYWPATCLGVGGLEAELGGGGLVLQATAKWCLIPQLEQVFPHAGHLSLFQICVLAQNLQRISLDFFSLD